MKTKPITVLIVLLVFAIPSLAQYRFNGRVVDDEGKPLSGANVYITALQKGILTNKEGEFSFDSPLDSTTITVTYIGYRPVVAAIDAMEFLEVTLHKQESTIEEVVVSTGYQNISKERATGSFGVVSQSDLDRQLSSDFKSRLEGVVPGMLFDNRSGGNHMKISIRGMSTLFSNLDPLIVLNQVPFDGSLDDINPNDIESITVLKDAAAASIWGARAGNGVIVITTKTGRSRTSPSLSFNTNFGIERKPDMSRLQLISSAEFLELESFLFSEKFYDSRYTDGYSRLSSWVSALYDNQEGRLSEPELSDLYRKLSGTDLRQQLNNHVYQHANSQQSNLSLRGGTDKYNYYYSLGYDQNTSILNQQATRITLRADQKIQISPRLGADISIFGTHSGQTAAHDGYTAYMTFPTYTPLKTLDGENLAVERYYRDSFIDEALADGLLDWSYRPLDEQGFSRAQGNENTVNINLGLRYILTEGLNLSLLYQLDKMYGTQNTLNESDSYFTRNMINQFSQVSGGNIVRPVPPGDILERSLNERQGQLARVQLAYNRDWGNHSITALSGMEAKILRNTGNSSWIFGYDANNLTFSNVDFNTMFSTYSPDTGWQRIPAGISLMGTTGKFLSAYINMGYTFMNRYSLSLSARQDGSNLFGVNTNQKFVPLWSAGGAWDIEKETFFNSNLFNALKIRATYGYNGNINTNVSSLTTMTTYTYGNINNQPFGSLRNPPNGSLRWERNAMFNVGVDFSMFSSSIEGSIEYYRKNSTDLIGYMPINQTTGARDPASSTYRYLGNSASTAGNGVDVMLKGYYGGKNLQISSTAVFGYADIKTSHYESEPASTLDYINGGQVISPIVGRPAYSIFALQWAGLDPENGDPKGILNGEVSKDYAAILNETDPSELAYFGSALPLFYGSFKQTFAYRRLSLSVMLAYRLGHYFRRPGVNYGALLNGTSSHSDYALRWKARGDEASTDVPSFQFPLDPNRDNFYARSSSLIGKASNIRLHDLSLSYMFPKIMGIDNLTLQFYARNLGIIWKAYDGEIDPEYGALGITPEYSMGIKFNL